MSCESPSDWRRFGIGWKFPTAQTSASTFHASAASAIVCIRRPGEPWVVPLNPTVITSPSLSLLSPRVRPEWEAGAL